MAAANSSIPEGGRRHAWLRALLAGPCALGLTALIIAVMPFWVPKGSGGVDHIAFPLFFMPAIWGFIFFYALLDRSLAPRSDRHDGHRGRSPDRVKSHPVRLRRSFGRGEAMINLKARETRTLVAVHGWAGAVLGLLLYAVIVTGTAAVFANEIKTWSGGLLGTSEPMSQPLSAVLARLEAETPKSFATTSPCGQRPPAMCWRSSIPMRRSTARAASAGFSTRSGRMAGSFRAMKATAETSRPTIRYTALGRFYVDLHVRLHVPNPWGLILTGILGLAMLVAAVSGILMHRHLFRDIFMLRGRDRLVGLRDLHSVAGTWTLPHAFVLAFTGAYLSFTIAVALPMLAKIAFKGDVREMVTTLNGLRAVDARPAAIANLDDILSDARKRAGAPLLIAGWITAAAPIRASRYFRRRRTAI